MGIVDAAGLLGLAALKTRTVTIRGGEIAIREMSLKDRNDFLAATKVSSIDAATLLVRRCVVGADGKPLMDDAGAAQLVEGAGQFMQDLAAEILKLSGLADDEGKDDGAG